MWSAGLVFAQSPFGEVIGRVVDQSSEGVPGVHVYIDNDGSRYQVKTDVDG